ncbi:hypothetical protein [Clostridium neonatale]|uniref:hypothetical protein n=1 Tax=Clostridium neonatale TaxID=137838 RepID=UPI00291BDC00|nr:hypothetical protein [Clostridium neonatale]CAI3571432.1 conserved hypothetical protein [Clostridium neonatale]CAI3655809.1 conserved hypothetical protein [Clostridium neonatale]
MLKVSILISRRENEVICPEDYKIGWLYQDDKQQSYWSVWGSAKNLKCALDCARITIKEKGAKEVYLSSVPLDKNLTLEQNLNLENITASM